MSRIAVVGAGLIGRLAAMHLHLAGHTITLFEQGDKRSQASAAYAAGGLLTPLGESLHSPDWLVNMGFASLKRWPELLGQLKQPVFFASSGSVAVAHHQDSGDMLRFSRHLRRHWPEHQADWLNQQALAELEPSLAHQFTQALYLPEEGQIDNRQLLDALRHELESLEVDWRCNQKVESAETLTAEFDWVIDTRGLGAHRELEQLRGVRGELFRLLAPEVSLTRPVRLMHPRYHLYIAPKPNHQFIVGATEIESDDEAPMTVRSALELLSAVYSVHSGFAEANILEQVSCCRPAFGDNHPKILRQGAVIRVNGLYRHGFLIAPVVLDHLLQLVADLHGAASNSYPFAELMQRMDQ